MTTDRVFGVVQVLLAGFALIASFQDSILTPPLINGEPLWTVYRVVQLGGLIGGVGLVVGSKFGRPVSIAFWSLQLIALTGTDWRLDLATALRFDVTMALSPGTVHDRNSASLAVGLNLLAVGALIVLSRKAILRKMSLEGDPPRLNDRGHR